MTLFKTALKNLKRSPVMNAISLLQLVAVFLVAAVMMSTMYIRRRSYEPIKDLLGGNGFFVSFYNTCGAIRERVYNDWRDSIFTVDELNSYMNADDVVYAKKTNVGRYDEQGEILSGVCPLMLFYDDEILSRCKPALKAGRWIDKNSDVLEIVISDNNIFGWELGDMLELYAPETFTWKDLTVKVVGIVEDDADIFGFHRSRDTANDTFRYMYDTTKSHYRTQEGTPTMIASESSAMRLYPGWELVFAEAFFIYDDDTPDELIKEKAMIVGQHNGDITINLEALNENSKAYLRSELLKLLPIVIMLLILVVVSSVSVSAIATRRRLKDYAKYYVLGLQWKQCAVVNLFQALITGTAALVISIAALFVISLTPISQTITIIFNAGLVLSLLAILALYLVFSMIMPLLMLKSTTPKALLQAD